MCLYSITFYVVSVALIDHTDEKCNFIKRQEFIGLKIIFFSTNGRRVYCKENPLSIAILYKMMSYLQN